MPHKEIVNRPNKSIPTKKLTLSEQSPQMVAPDLKRQPQWEAWLWKRVQKSIPVCLAAVIGLFAIGETTQTAKAADTIVDYQQRRSWTPRSYTSGLDTYYTYYSPSSISAWANFVNGTGDIDRYTFGNEWGDGGIISALQRASDTGGGTTYLSDARLAGSTGDAPTGSWATYPGIHYQYQSAWVSQISTGGTVNLANSVRLLDERNASYTITTLTKNGVGILTLDSTTQDTTTYTSNVFNGNAGGLTVNADYRSYTANIGGTFVGNVGSGRTWTADDLNVNAQFTKQGSGTLTGTTANINSTSNMEGGEWNYTLMNVGMTANGTLNITGGQVNADNFKVGANTGQTGVVNLSYSPSPTQSFGILNTGMNGGITEIGSLADGTLNITGALDGTTTLSPIWTANGLTVVGAGSTGTVNLNTYSRWVSLATTDIGISNQGTVNINTDTSSWNASGQVVNVGKGAGGAVRQLAGEWRSGTTNVGLETSGVGVVDQSGGTHEDNYANVGVAGIGTYNLSGTGKWNTTDNAVIGVAATGNGRVNVKDPNAKWTIGTDAIAADLTVADKGYGRLDITNSGVVQVVGGDVVVGVDDSSVYISGNQGRVDVNTNGELLVDKGNLTVAQGGQSVMNITNEGLVDVKEGWVTIGENANVTGTVNVEGDGSILNIGQTDPYTLANSGDNLYVGYYGNGNLNVRNGGLTDVLAGDVIFGVENTGKGNGLVTGVGSELQIREGDLVLGEFGNGNLVTADKGFTQVAQGDVFIAKELGSIGEKTVRDDGSIFRIDLGALHVGHEGKGKLNVLDGGLANVVTGNAVFGTTITGEGTGLVSGVDAILLVQQGDLIIGDAGIGTLTTAADGLTRVQTGDVFIARQENSKGTKTVAGSGAVFQIDQGDLYVGYGGDGDLNVWNGGVTDVWQGDVVAGELETSYGEINVGTGGTLDVHDGNLTIARKGDGSNMTIMSGGMVNVLVDTDPSAGNLYIADTRGVHGTVTVNSSGKLYVENDLVVGEYGLGTLAGTGGIVEVEGNLITGHQNGSVGTVVVTGLDITVKGDDIIGDERGSFGHQTITGIGADKTVVGTQVVGNVGAAGGKYIYYPGAPYDVLTPPALYADPNSPPTYTDSRGWLTSPNMTFNPQDNASPIPPSPYSWADVMENAPGLAITFGAKETSGQGIVGAFSGGYGYVLIDNFGNNTLANPTAQWNVERDLLIGGEGEAYARVINGGQLNVGTARTGDGILIVGQNGNGNEGGTLRVNGTSGTGANRKHATVWVETDMTVGEKARAEGNLYVSNEGYVNVDGNLTLAKEGRSLGRAHFDGNFTAINVGDTLTIADAGLSGGKYIYVSNDVANDPVQWWDSPNTLNWQTNLGTVANNAPGMVISDKAVVNSLNGVVANQAGSYGYVVIDNKSDSLDTAARATWNVTNDLTVANGGDAYMRILNGGLLNVTNDMTIANEARSTATVRVNGVNPVRDTERAELNVGHDLVIAQKGTAEGNLYAYGQSKTTVENDMIISKEQNSHGRAQFDGDKTTAQVNGTLIVGDEGTAGRRFVYEKGKEGDADPGFWFDSDNTLGSLSSSASPVAQNNMPGLLISDGAVVGAQSGIVGNAATGYGYVVIDNRNGGTGTSGQPSRSTWNINGIPADGDTLKIGNSGEGYVRVINGGLLTSTNGVDIIVGTENGGTGTVRVNGMKSDGQRSTIDANGNLIVGKEGGSMGSLYLYDNAYGHVGADDELIIAEQANSRGRVQIDGDGTEMRVEGTAVIGQSGQAGGKYKVGSGTPNPGDPGNWFDSDNTLIDLRGSSNLLSNAPGLLVSNGGLFHTNNAIAAENEGSYGYAVVDGRGDGRSEWRVDDTLIFAQDGEAYGRIINGGLLQVGSSGNNGTMIIGEQGNSKGTLDVYGIRADGTQSELVVYGTLTTAKEANSKGNLYVFDRAKVTVEGDHIIADEAGSIGRDYIDGDGTTMHVSGMLTVGNNGQAGGTYMENRYDSRFGVTPTFAPNSADLLTAGDPEDWFAARERQLLDMNMIAGDVNNARTGANTGNIPGLAITSGAQVFSGSGMVGNTASSSGYVVIDDKGHANSGNYNRTMWQVDDNLTIADSGIGFVRVLNGALLETGSLTVNGNGGDGTLHVVGVGAEMDGDNYKQIKIGVDVDRDNGIYQGMYIAKKTEAGNLTEWINKGPAILGDGTGTDKDKGTIRINDGGYGETHGLYIGLAEDTTGTVSVMGAGSLLRVYEGDGSVSKLPEGSGSLSVSNRGWVSLEENSEIRLNGNAMFSNDAVLHLEDGTSLDAMTDRVSVVNARIEGIGTVSGKKGVFVTQDDLFTPGGQAEIDPGLAYSWEVKDDDALYYGTLTFGDQLTLSGDVKTYFDINSGYDGYTDKGHQPKQDLIVVKRGESPDNAQVTSAPITASLSGTLQVHARLTDYYQHESDLLVVKTEGDDKIGGTLIPGRILSLYDTVDILPSRWFLGREQEIRKDGVGNDQLWITMTLNEHPFEESGVTHNQRQTGRALDSIYAARDQDWLPFLRGFWYLDDPAFQNAVRNYSGEIRAHSLMMPIRNPWLYIPERVDGNRLAFFADETPCDQAETEYCRPGEYRRKIDKYLKHFKHIKGTRLWGSYILESEDMKTDGNAFGYDLNRQGIVVGVDHDFKNEDVFFGLMFAFDEGKLSSYRSGAETDDFNLGLYHRMRFQKNWEWKNYLGMGYQGYDMWRNTELGLAYLPHTDDPNCSLTEFHEYFDNPEDGGRLDSRFNGYSMALSTELSREFFFGHRERWMAKPYMALDLNGFWQGAAEEDPSQFENAHFVTLDYLRTNDIRVHWRPGIALERAGRHGNLRAMVSYSFRMGGRGYTSVENRFQYHGGDKFNIRGVDDGIGFVTVNLGTGFFLDKKKTSLATFDYRMLAGSHSATHALQLGAQKKF